MGHVSFYKTLYVLTNVFNLSDKLKHKIHEGKSEYRNRNKNTEKKTKKMDGQMWHNWDRKLFIWIYKSI